jgi:hypothetical protein
MLCVFKNVVFPSAHSFAGRVNTRSASHPPHPAVATPHSCHRQCSFSQVLSASSHIGPISKMLLFNSRTHLNIAPNSTNQQTHAHTRTHAHTPYNALQFLCFILCGGNLEANVLVSLKIVSLMPWAQPGERQQENCAHSTWQPLI